MGLILMFALGVAMLFAPVFAGVANFKLGVMATTVFLGAGLVFVILAGILFVITRLYVRTKANMAFVRTGAKGKLVIMDGGGIVIPLIHELMPVSLESTKLVVRRIGSDALLTHDKLRADIHAEFFVKVKADSESIINASRTLGERMQDMKQLQSFVEEKVISALRSVAATRTLEDLNSKRDEFIHDVRKNVQDELRPNGLELESATISHLDQTDPKGLNPDNVFDAQGLRTIAEITQKQRTEQNQLVRQGEQARMEQDVTTRAAILGQEQKKAELEATQQAEIKKIQAFRNREAEEKRIEAERQIAMAGVDKERQVEVAKREQEQAVEVAERQKIEAVVAADQKVEVATRAKAEAVVEADKKVEVANRAKEVAVAEAETTREKALGERAKAQALAEKERQEITTVQVVEAAERAKRQQIIEAQAKAETGFVEKQRGADAEAYGIKTRAEADKGAAEARAAAVLRQAEAEAEAETKKAAGKMATEMVPVQVKAEEVKVNNAAADVEIKLLENQQRFGEAGVKLKIRLAEIEASAEVGRAGAEALGVALSHANMTMYGSTDMLNNIMRRFGQGQSVMAAIQGATDAMDPGTKAMLQAGAEAIAGKLGVDVEKVKEAVAALPSSHRADVVDTTAMPAK